MEEGNPATTNTRLAIELLTLWMEPGDEARARMAEHITSVLSGPEDQGGRAFMVGTMRNAHDAISGLLNLSMLLALQLARARGASDDEMLGRAGDILRGISASLPE